VALEAQMQGKAATADIPLARRFYWSVRRELWENRSVWLAPPAVGGLALLGFLLHLAHLPQKVRTTSDAELHAIIEQPYVVVALMLMVVDMVVAVFYSVDALYGERRDRSVLFWKSLPVSDLTAVLAKASVPILVLPFIVFVVTAVTQLVMLLLSSAVLGASGLGAGTVWMHVPFLKTAGYNLYHLVVFHGIWYAPFFGWFLMVSAWARRAPFLWAVLPPVGIGVFEKVAFNTSHFGMAILERFGGNSPSEGSSSGMSMEMFTPHHAMHFVLGSGMWFGLALTAFFLYCAVRLRRSRATI
jgi:ABC-2 type transport system permease protein